MRSSLAEGWFDLGRAFRELGRYEEAVASFRAAALLEPGDAEVRHRLGVCLTLLRRDAEAVQAFRAALARDPAHAGSRYNLSVLLKRVRPAEAASHLSVLRRSDPELAELLEAQLEGS